LAARSVELLISHVEFAAGKPNGIALARMNGGYGELATKQYPVRCDLDHTRANRALGRVGLRRAARASIDIMGDPLVSVQRPQADSATVTVLPSVRAPLVEPHLH
jgi:hypothetical protein